MKTSTEEAAEVARGINDYLAKHFNLVGDSSQVRSSIMPIIGNAIYQREQLLLEKERLETLITLARTLEGSPLADVIKALDYKVVLATKK